MKKIIFGFLYLFFCINNMNAQQWSKEKADNWYNKRQWLCGFNYIPSDAVNYVAMWDKTSFNPTLIDKELALAKQTGFNCLRVVLQYVVWFDDSIYFKKTFLQFLDICDRHQMTVVPCLFDDCTFDTLGISRTGKQVDPIAGWYAYGWAPSPGHNIVDDRTQWKSLEKYVKEIISFFKTDKRILLWDLYNEPTNRPKNQQNSVELAEQVFKWARVINTQHPLSIALWNNYAPFQKTALNELALTQSDIITFHCYEKLDKLKSFVELLQSYHRPVICTEWLNRWNGSTVETHLPFFC